MDTFCITHKSYHSNNSDFNLTHSDDSAPTLRTKRTQYGLDTVRDFALNSNLLDPAQIDSLTSPFRGRMPNNGPKLEWQQLYEAAAKETDPQKLTTLVAAVESALMNRQQELGLQPGHDIEPQEMKAAGQKLLFIKTQKLGWPEIKLDRQ